MNVLDNILEFEQELQDDSESGQQALQETDRVQTHNAAP